ncbi:precorrin-8X methylmutase [Coralliovum pocilloporae]|uniref:precorrin-8X methylmutase n=1 Tax=Coralliovum pocilloporae TaxID=3066369 RepID=UPI0033074A6F
MFDYIRDPAAIYEESFRQIRDAVDLSQFPESMHGMVQRLVHSSGIPEIADDLAFTDEAVTKGRAALEAGAPILCDARMVAMGVIERVLPASNPVLCMLEDERTRPRALEIGNTRSAAAVDLWQDRLDGAVVAIGNAPTALFYLLEMIAKGAPKPAVILGFPVGFVGAAESKQALAESDLGLEFITLHGRKGGSAYAAAAVNALAIGAGAVS